MKEKLTPKDIEKIQGSLPVHPAVFYSVFCVSADSHHLDGLY